MGPRAFAHGDFLFARNSPVETHPLQWGRGLSPTETQLLRTNVLGNTTGFNGAAGFRPRRQFNLLIQRFILESFNGAAGFRPRRHLRRAFD